MTPYSVAYNGASHTATGTEVGAVGESLTGLALGGTTHTSAGTTTDAWTFTDATGNYSNATGTVSDVITKANATIVVTPYSGDVQRRGAHRASPEPRRACWARASRA